VVAHHLSDGSVWQRWPNRDASSARCRTGVSGRITTGHGPGPHTPGRQLPLPQDGEGSSPRQRTRADWSQQPARGAARPMGNWPAACCGTRYGRPAEKRVCRSTAIGLAKLHMKTAGPRSYVAELTSPAGRVARRLRDKLQFMGDAWSSGRCPGPERPRILETAGRCSTDSPEPVYRDVSRSSVGHGIGPGACPSVESEGREAHNSATTLSHPTRRWRVHIVHGGNVQTGEKPARTPRLAYRADGKRKRTGFPTGTRRGDSCGRQQPSHSERSVQACVGRDKKKGRKKRVKAAAGTLGGPQAAHR